MNQDQEHADNETLANELARLVREYEMGGEHSEEAWNLIADFAVCNSNAIVDALRKNEATTKT